MINAIFHEQGLTDKLRSHAKKLLDMGILERAGRNKYVLARSLYAAIGKSGVHTRLVGLDRETNKELLLRHIGKNGKRGTPLSELRQVLPGHSKDQIQTLMKELKADKKVTSSGRTRAAKWFLAH